MDKEKMDKEFSEITKKHEESFQIEYQEYLRLRKYLFTPLGFAKPVFPNYHPQPYRPIGKKKKHKRKFSKKDKNIK